MKLKFKTVALTNRYFRRYFPDASNDEWCMLGCAVGGHSSPPYATMTVEGKEYWILRARDSFEGHRITGIELHPK